MAKDSNSKMGAVAQRAKDHEEKTLEKKYNQFTKQVKKFHEKLVVRQENLDWQQYETAMANEKRRQHHTDVSSKMKQLDRNKLLESIQSKQDAAQHRVQAQEREQEESWKIYNEEAHHKQVERQKKMQRNLRKVELKKEAVVRKQQKNEVQVAYRKMQADQAI